MSFLFCEKFYSIFCLHAIKKIISLITFLLLYTYSYYAISSEPITPLPQSISLNLKQVALGEKLFNDKRLSKNNTVSCASCHDLKKGGTDNQSRSIGIGGKKGEINSPTVFNSGFNFRQFWDGRASSLEEQIEGPINNPVEMGNNWKNVIKVLKKDKTYQRDFKRLYKEGINKKNIKSAIAEFERSLITPDAAIDRYLRGDKNALNANEKKGYDLFKSYGCIACHQGTNIGGNMYQVFGILNNYFEQRGDITSADLGRYNITKKEYDKHKFKVPSLRNIELTAPYLHDGTVKTLEDMVEVMAKFQLGRSMPTTDRDLIVQFLKTLTGTYQGKSLQGVSK